MRYVFEYGNTFEPAAGKPRVVAFVRRVPKEEGGVWIGPQCEIKEFVSSDD